jgi:RHS repeat-associated protein
VVAEYDATNVLRASYLTTLGSGDLPGTPLESTVGSTRTYPLLDGVGSVTAFTDSAGSVSSAFSYTAYGSPVGASSGTYAYGTYGYDSVTGLYYARARYYDAAGGRFLSEDPVNDRNLYVYAVGNPVSRLDPSGGAATTEYELIVEKRGGSAIFRTAQLAEKIEADAPALERQILDHVCTFHRAGAGVANKSEFLTADATEIRNLILSALRYGEMSPSGNSVAFQLTFESPIGLLRPDLTSFSYTIRVIVDVAAQVLKTAYPV